MSYGDKVECFAVSEDKEKIKTYLKEYLEEISEYGCTFIECENTGDVTVNDGQEIMIEESILLV